MLDRIRLFAGAVVLAGAALLASPKPAEATMSLPISELLRTRFCCGGDSNGDRRPETYCCFSTGCAVGPTGCVRAS
jgi:hypothetical protein